jgi:glycosyltransferase involved in cell wall biosynthesis
MKTEKLYNFIRPILYRLRLIDLAYKLLTPNMRATIARRTGLGDYISPLPPRERFSGRVVLDGINYIADLRADIGVGEASRGIYAALTSSALPLDYHEIVTPLVSRTHEAPEPAKNRVPRYGVTFVNANAPEMRIAFQQYPQSFEKRYVIAYWHWEVPRFPKRWLSRMDIVDEIWVGSRYTQQILAQVGSVPVRTMPTPIRMPTPTRSREAVRSEFGIPVDRFVFFFVFNPGSSMARKNPYGLIDAYRRAFGDDLSPQKPLLVIKAHHLSDPMHQSLADDFRAAVAAVGGMLIDQHLSREAMNDLLNACDCFVSLHRAEGFGLSIAEAMALGKPVIATAYSANTDFMTTANSYEVGYTLRPITLEDHALQPSLQAIYAPGENQVWAEPNIDQAAALMQHVVAHPEEAQERGQRAAQDIATQLSTEAVGQQIRARLEQLEHREGLPTS